MPGIGPIAGPLVVPWALLPDAGCASADQSLIGAANRGHVIPCTLYAPCILTGVRFRVHTQSGNISVALYSQSLARLATSGGVSCPAPGNVTVSFTASVSVPAGRYYLGLSCDNNTAYFGVSSAGGYVGGMGSKYMANAYPLPDPFVSAGPAPFTWAVVGLVNGGWTP